MRQRGVALITAIVLVAIATVLAVRIGTRAALDLRRTTGLAALDQGWQVALGAEAWADEVLKDDDPESDHLAEAWAQPVPPLPIDGGEVRGALEDMQGRFNLNNLVGEDRKINESQVEIFRQLLLRVGAQERWAGMMADWLDDDTVPHGVDGAEDGTYLSQSPPYRAANVLVTTTTEMMALPGMTRDEFERIRPYVAALPVGTTINLCTAKSPVLAALERGGVNAVPSAHVALPVPAAYWTLMTALVASIDMTVTVSPPAGSLNVPPATMPGFVPSVPAFAVAEASTSHM